MEMWLGNIEMIHNRHAYMYTHSVATKHFVEQLGYLLNCFGSNRMRVATYMHMYYVAFLTVLRIEMFVVRR